MINLYVLFKNFTASHAPKNLRKKFAQIPPNARIQDAASIFWYPNNVVLGSICSMSRKTNFHSPIVPQYLRRVHSPTGKPVELCPSGF